MSKRKISTNLPSDLLEEAVEISQLNQTAAIVEGLKELIKREKRKKLLALEGEIKIRFDVDKSRQRSE